MVMQVELFLLILLIGGLFVDRNKSFVLISFLKYLSVLLFLIGIGLSYIVIISDIDSENFFQHFSVFLPEYFSSRVQDTVFIASAFCFTVAYLSANLRHIFVKSETYNPGGDLVIKKIAEVDDKRNNQKENSRNETEITALVRQKIDTLFEQVNAARHDLFNLMLDINGIHSADDAQRSLDSLEKSANIIKELKKLTVNEK